MSKEVIKELKDYHKRCIESIDNYYLSDSFYEIHNKVFNELDLLHNKIDKAIEYINGEEFFLLMNSIQTPDKAVCEDYFKAKGNLLEILKDSDVDE